MPRLAVAVAILASLVATASRADTVYATSFSTGELIRYDSTDPAGTKTVLSGSGTLAKPAAIAVGPDGNLYIGEDGDGATIAPRITRYTVASGSVSTVHTFAAFDVFPGSLAFKGTDLLVGRNPFFGNTGPIVKVAGATGSSTSVSDYTTGGSLASSPGLALAADGRLYVSDQTYSFGTGIASGPVKRFDATGTYVGEVIASGSSGLYGPTGLAINGSTLYTASIMTGAVLRTDLGTDVTTTFASTGGVFEVGPLALLADGTILAGSPSGSGSIYHFGTNGTLLSTYASGLGQVGGIVAVAAVPEPASITLAAGGLAAVGCLLRRRTARNTTR
jgi:sugar lactone lactonase YvrE